MPLGIPNPNPVTPPAKPKRSPNRGTARSIGTPLRPGTGNTQGPVAPGTMTPSGTPYSSFQSQPEYAAPPGFDPSNPLQGASLEDAAYARSLGGNQAVLDWRGSGLPSQVWAGLGPEGQSLAAQWGTNLPRAADLIGQQRAAYDLQQGQQQQTNAYIDEFGAIQNLQQDNLTNQFLSGVGMAQGRYDLGVGQLQQGLDTDLGLLEQRRVRDIDLSQQDNTAGLLHNANMRGVLQDRQGIRGDVYNQQRGFLNQQAGFLGERQTNAFNQFESRDAYAAGQSQDLMAQYGFNAEQFAQQGQEAFANRNTQQRAAVSDAAARGGFSSAGFGDNISDIYGQYERTQQANSLNMDRTNEALDVRDRSIGNERANLRFGYNDQRTGFAQDAAGIGNAQAQNRNNYRDSQAVFRGQFSANDKERSQLQNVDKGLASLAKEYGIKEQDLRNQFENSITKMDLDLNETTQKLEQMLNSGNAAAMASATSFMQQMMAYQ